MDLQAVIVDKRGLIIDAAYYNNVSACDGAVSMSEDETSGSKKGYDESMWLRLKTMPENVQMVLFIIAVYGAGHLRDICNGQLTFLQDGIPLKIFCARAAVAIAM